MNVVEQSEALKKRIWETLVAAKVEQLSKELVSFLKEENGSYWI